jgi:isocitrate/isopropylmalate dehydrogenase
MIQSLYYGLYHGIIAHEWVLGDDDKNYAFPIHGRVRELEGMDIINPIASVLALCTLIESSHATLSMQIKHEVLHHYFVNKENTTPDRGGVLNTSTYIRKLVEKLQQNH